MLDYKLVAAVAAVIEEGGFERAASVLHITQSAVSQRVKLLEDRLGQALIVRGAPVRPTEAGKRLLRYYHQVGQLESELMHSVQPDEAAGYSCVRIGVNADSLATWFLPALAPLLSQQAILVDVFRADQEQTHDLLRNGEVLGCISTREKPIQGCRSQYLGCMPYLCCASPEFAVRWFPDGFTAQAACNAPCTTYDRTDELQARVLAQLGLGPADFPTHYVPDSRVFAEFCTSGLGWGMLPYIQVAEELQSGRLVEVDSAMRQPVHLFWHSWNLETRVLDAVTKALVSYARSVLEQ